MAQSEHHSADTPYWPPTSADYDRLLAHIEALQQQLDQVRGELVWSHRLTTLGTMAAILAHEYNNLLTPLNSYAQLALSEPGDAKLTRKALQTVIDGVQRATAIASATLEFARPGDRSEQIAGVRDAIDRSLDCLARPLERDGIDLQLNITDCRVRLCPVQLQQVMVNLLTNARKAMLSAPGSHRLVITTETDNEQASVSIQVSDNGPGIPQSIRERIFEPFVTCAHDDRTLWDTPSLEQTADSHPAASNPPAPNSAAVDKPPPGTGLGLSICKDLIESASGRIEVVSAPGQGTTIRLTLPMAD